MNNPETHGSVQQPARDGEALPTVALPTEGSAPLAGEDADVERLHELARELHEARQWEIDNWNNGWIDWDIDHFCKRDALLFELMEIMARHLGASSVASGGLSDGGTAL